MDEERESAQDIKRRDFVSMCLAVLTLGTVGFSLWACGDDDLAFPGQIPPTSTPTRTETPDDEEEDDDDGLG
jgi:hypothetical protein